MTHALVTHQNEPEIGVILEELRTSPITLAILQVRIHGDHRPHTRGHGATAPRNIQLNSSAYVSVFFLPVSSIRRSV